MSENTSISPDTQPRKPAQPQPVSVSPDPETGDDLSVTQPGKAALVPQAASVSEPETGTETDLSATQPGATAQPVAPSKPKGRFGFLIALVIMLGALVLGSLGGYNWGIGIRVEAEQATVSKSLGEQFALAQEDFTARRYELARQRLEYIIREDASFAGATELLGMVLIEMSITASPTVTPSPTLTPTPDLRQQEAIFAQAQAQIQASDWDAALGSLDALRKRDASYQAAQVDGMYYVVLRNRGTAKILGQGIYGESPNLEGGIYDLTLAERFGPLDGQAAGYRNIARMYIQGATYWELDWTQALNYFEEVARLAPYMRDGSLMTATDRYRIALLRRGDELAAAEKLKDRCEALPYWEVSNSIVALDNDYNYKYLRLQNECYPPTEVPSPTPSDAAAPNP